MRHRGASYLGLLWVLATVATARGDASFQGLGTLENDLRETSSALAVSADGSTVVGFDHREIPILLGGVFEITAAFRWTSAGGMEYVPSGILALDPYSLASGVSADGSVVVGSSSSRAFGFEPFRWSATGGGMGLGVLADDPPAPSGLSFPFASAVSADGSVVVGTVQIGSGGDRAFRWTEADGMSALADVLAEARDVSADGTVIVGRDDRQAFVWTAADGLVAIGDLPGGSVGSAANAVSDDGAVVVGSGTTDAGTEAFRWTAPGPMLSLGDLSGGLVLAEADDVSADGAVVVGTGRTDAGNRAFVWDAFHGMRSVEDVLGDDPSVDLASWVLTRASGVSADGRTIVGTGVNERGLDEAWRAGLPEPGPAGCAVEMTKSVFRDGEPVTPSTLRFVNRSDAPLPVRLRIEVGIPGSGTQVPVALGADGALALPAGFDQELAPTLFWTVDPDHPRGLYSVRCVIEDAAGSAVLDADIARFEVR